MSFRKEVIQSFSELFSAILIIIRIEVEVNESPV